MYEFLKWHAVLNIGAWIIGAMFHFGELAPHMELPTTLAGNVLMWIIVLHLCLAGAYGSSLRYAEFKNI